MNCICYQQCNDKNSRVMTIIPKHTIIYYVCAKATSFITQNHIKTIIDMPTIFIS